MRTSTAVAITLALSLCVGAGTSVAGPCSTSGSGTALGKAAAGLAEHEWCELSTNLSASIMETCSQTGNDHINTYADSMAWDAVRKRVYFIGTPHNGQGKWLVYDTATNSWSATVTSNPPLGCNVSGSCDGTYSNCNGARHGYDHNTADPDGNFYWRYPEQTKIWKWDGSGWSTIADSPYTYNIANAIEYFPERGGLFFFMENNDARFWTRATNSWSSNLLNGSNCSIDGQGYHLFAEYSPAHHLVWFGAGNGGVKSCTYSQNGTIAQEANAPVGLGVTNQLVSADPVGGNFIVHSEEYGTWKEYDPLNNTWSSINWSMPPLWFQGSSGDAALDNIEVAIPDYGVIMYVSYLGGSPKTFIYKHGAASEATQPEQPANLEVR